MVLRRLLSRARRAKKPAKPVRKPKPKAARRKARPKAAKVRSKTRRAVVKARVRRLKTRAPRTKAVRKVARHPARKVRPAAPRKAVVVRRPKAEAQPELMAKEVGRVTHYFDKISVAVIELSSMLRQGDQIYIKGHTTDVKQRTASMQVNHMPVSVANAGESIGLKVSGRVREGDRVFRLG